MTSCRMIVSAGALSLFGCGDGGGFPDAPLPDAPPPKGTFSLAWTVTDTDGAAVTCDQIGAQTVTAVLRNPDVQGGSTEVFSCSAGSGTSPGIAPGHYQIDFELNGSDAPNGLIQTAPRQEVDIVSGQNTQLQPLAFAVDATGGLALSLNAIGVTQGNCAATPDGAGIDQFTITLEKASDLTCANVTLNVSAGAMGGTAGTYAINCATPVTRPCLYTDQTLSVAGLDSGNYRIHVRGRSGTNCYINDDTIAVPALGMTRTETLNLSKQMAMCP